LPKNTTKCPRPGLELGLLYPETSTLAMRPPCLPYCSEKNAINHNFVFANLNNYGTNYEEIPFIVYFSRLQNHVVGIQKLYVKLL